MNTQLQSESIVKATFWYYFESSLMKIQTSVLGTTPNPCDERDTRNFSKIAVEIPDADSLSLKVAQSYKSFQKKFRKAYSLYSYPVGSYSLFMSH